RRIPGGRHPPGETDAVVRPRPGSNARGGPREVLAGLWPRLSDDEEGPGGRARPPAAVRPPGDGAPDRSESRGRTESLGPSAEEGSRGPRDPRGPRGCPAGASPLTFESLGRDPEGRAHSLLPMAVLVEDRRAGARSRPLEPEDRLRVVAQHVPAEGQVRARVEVRVDL